MSRCKKTSNLDLQVTSMVFEICGLEAYAQIVWCFGGFFGMWFWEPRSGSGKTVKVGRKNGVYVYIHIHNIYMCI